MGVRLRLSWHTGLLNCRSVVEGKWKLIESIPSAEGGSPARLLQVQGEPKLEGSCSCPVWWAKVGVQVTFGPPPCTETSTIFELWLGGLGGLSRAERKCTRAVW